MTALAQPDTVELRRVFGAFPTGVTALAVHLDDGPVGLAASSFTSVSLEPPLGSVCVTASSQTWTVLRHAPRIGVSVLSEGHEAACRQLAARTGDRFAGLSWRATPEGAVLLDEASAWFDCSIDQVIPAGDHNIVVLAVHEYADDPRLAPLVFHGSQFRRLNL